jgi:RNA polymerase sigma factor (sigma-70 family)
MADQHLLYAEHKDGMLVNAVIRGETGAFKELIHNYEKLVNSIVYKMVGQTQDREDICQETFLKVYKNLASFKFQSRLSTWIGNIAFNLCVNYLKKKKTLLLEDFTQQGINKEETETYDISMEVKDHELLPDETLLDKERLHLLFKAVEGLNPIERTLLQLFHQEGLSIEEMFSITSIPVNTIKSHLFRARKNLKNQMIKLLNS